MKIILVLMSDLVPVIILLDDKLESTVPKLKPTIPKSWSPLFSSSNRLILGMIDLVSSSQIFYFAERKYPIIYYN